jgi:hypothetical protein
MNPIGKNLEIMLLVATLAAAATIIGLGAASARAETPKEVCSAHDTVKRTLSDRFAEKTVSIGLANNGAVVEVLSSPNGTWTIVMTAPNGVTCLIAAGDYWQSVPEKVAGKTL